MRSCHEFIELLLESPQNQWEVMENLTLETLKQLGGSCQISRLKEKLIQGEQAFSEKALGFTSFLKYLKALDSVQCITDTVNNVNYVTLTPDVTPQETAAEAPEAMIKSVGKVLQITDMFGPSINPNNGDYSVGCSGFWHDGEGNVVPVSEITVADNLVDMFARLIPANDIEKRGRKFIPSLLIEGMTIAGR